MKFLDDLEAEASSSSFILSAFDLRASFLTGAKLGAVIPQITRKHKIAIDPLATYGKHMQFAVELPIK